MPIIKRKLSIASGATSDNVFANTTYQTVDPGTRLVVAMGDLSTATALFAQLSGIQVGEQEFVLILTKRFRNDGPVVTKAALRKTRTTVRRLKSMCDMYDSLRPAATRRKAPMKRATSTTLIRN